MLTPIPPVHTLAVLGHGEDTRDKRETTSILSERENAIILVLSTNTIKYQASIAVYQRFLTSDN